MGKLEEGGEWMGLWWRAEEWGNWVSAQRGVRERNGWITCWSEAIDELGKVCEDYLFLRLFIVLQGAKRAGRRSCVIRH